MLNLQEIDEAIAELESGKTTYSACAKLADLYAVREHIMQEMNQNDTMPVYARGYSSAAMPVARIEDSLGEYGDSDFLITIAGKAPASAWKIIDELMDTLKIIQPRIYDTVMRRMDMAD